MSDTEVIVFARTPVLGTVKTRLASSVGDARALAIYQLLTAHVLRAICVADRRWTVTVAYTPDSTHSRTAMLEWLQAIECIPDLLEAQSNGDLGVRMHSAITTALTRSERQPGNHKRNAIVIGTDCPFVTAKTIDDTIEALRTSECVLGPALDGGYYLIGTSRGDLPVFHQMQWSTERVFAESMTRLNEHNVSVATLAVERDVDTLDDWNAISPRLEPI